MQNLGSSELSSQSFTLSQYFEDGIHLPLEQANSEIEQPINGSLISNLYAAAVPRTSPYELISSLFVLFDKYNDVGVGVVNAVIDFEYSFFASISAMKSLFFLSKFKLEFPVVTIDSDNELFMQIMTICAKIKRSLLTGPFVNLKVSVETIVKRLKAKIQECTLQQFSLTHCYC